MAGGGADEVAALLGDQGRDRLGVVAAERLAGQDHDAGVDLVRTDARRRIGVVDDGAELRLVDALLARIGRERDRRLEQRLARDHVVAAGELLAEPAQIDAREDDLRAGRADVDADGRQRHVVGDPDRVFLERQVVGEIVVVVRIAVMRMREIDPEAVVRDRVALLVGRIVLGLVGPRHQLISVKVGLALSWGMHLFIIYLTHRSIR